MNIQVVEKALKISACPLKSISFLTAVTSGQLGPLTSLTALKLPWISQLFYPVGFFFLCFSFFFFFWPFINLSFFSHSYTKTARQRCRAGATWGCAPFRNMPLVCPATRSPRAVVGSCALSKTRLNDSCWKNPEICRTVLGTCQLCLHEALKCNAVCFGPNVAQWWFISWGTSELAETLPISMVFTVNIALFHLLFKTLEILEEQDATDGLFCSEVNSCLSQGQWKAWTFDPGATYGQKPQSPYWWKCPVW